MSFAFWLSAATAAVAPGETTPQLRKSLLDQQFYSQCDRLSQGLLERCKWQIACPTESPILVITCSSLLVYWRVISRLEAMSQSLGHLSHRAKIRVYRPLGLGIPY